MNLRSLKYLKCRWNYMNKPKVSPFSSWYLEVSSVTLASVFTELTLLSPRFALLYLKFRFRITTFLTFPVTTQLFFQIGTSQINCSGYQKKIGQNNIWDKIPILIIFIDFWKEYLIKKDEPKKNYFILPNNFNLHTY